MSASLAQRQPLELGAAIYYRSPDMPKRRRGFVAGGDENGWHVKGLRQGHNFSNKHIVHVLPREQIWTVAEFKAEMTPLDTRVNRKLRPELVKERAQLGTERLGIPEGDVLTHPGIVRSILRKLARLAGSNDIGTRYVNRNGLIVNDDPWAMDLYSEFITAGINSLRRQTANAPEEMVEEFRSQLQGLRDSSRIFFTIMRDGTTAAIRFLQKRAERFFNEDCYDTVMESDFESGMYRIASVCATQHIYGGAA